MLNIILTFIGGNILGFIKHLYEEKEETKRERMRTDSQIEIARIQSENSTAARRNSFKKMLEKYNFELKKSFNEKRGNKIVDTIRGLMAPFVTVCIFSMTPKVANIMLSNPASREKFCDCFLLVIVAVIGTWMGGKIPMKHISFRRGS